MPIGDLVELRLVIEGAALELAATAFPLMMGVRRGAIASHLGES